ncbi:MAG: hypothetical protein AB9866_00625 [Syntrophobacteraceae bacterium]
MKQIENLAELDLVQLKSLHPALLRRILRYGLQKVREVFQASAWCTWNLSWR